MRFFKTAYISRTVRTIEYAQAPRERSDSSCFGLLRFSAIRPSERALRRIRQARRFIVAHVKHPEGPDAKLRQFRDPDPRRAISGWARSNGLVRFTGNPFTRFNQAKPTSHGLDSDRIVYCSRTDYNQSLDRTEAAGWAGYPKNGVIKKFGNRSSRAGEKLLTPMKTRTGKRVFRPQGGCYIIRWKKDLNGS